MSTTNVQLMDELTLPREFRLICEVVNNYTDIIHMFPLLFHLLSHSVLSLDDFPSGFWIVLMEETLLSICVHSHISTDVFLHLIPSMVQINTWTENEPTRKATSVNI